MTIQTNCTPNISEGCPTVPSVTKGLCVASGCTTITCVTKTVTFTQTPAGCTSVTVYTDSAGAVLTNVKETPCPQKVEVITPNPPAPVLPITITGADCAGAPVTATGLPQQIVQTVPHPSAVQLVKICGDKPKFDREMVTLCTPSGTKVIVQNVTPEDAPLGTAPVFEAWNLNGTAYTGAVSALVDCGADKVNTEHTDYCAGGLNFTRVDGLAEDTGVPVWTIWLDDAGLPVAQPVGAVKGKCEVCQPKPCCPRTTFYNAGTCREIKVVDTLQCDGTYTTQGFELNNTVIAGFDPSKLVAECPCVLLSAANLQTWA